MSLELAVLLYATLNLCAYGIKRRQGYVGSAPVVSTALGVWAAVLLVG